MQKNFKADLDSKYDEILRSLYVKWKKQFKFNEEQLAQNGLLKSGAGVNSFYNLIEKLVKETLENIKELFNKLPEKYNRKILESDMKKYQDKIINNIKGHISLMDKEINEYYKEDKLFSNESNKIRITNIEQNAENEIKRIFNEIENYRKGKKIEGLVIFNIFFTISSFFIGLVSLIISIIK